MHNHVCHVITTLGAGGAEQYVVQLSNSLKTAGICVSVVAGEPHDLGERLMPDIHVETIKLHPGNSRSSLKYMVLIFPAIKRLVDYFRRERITVVHTHLAASALPAWIAAKMCGIPVIHSKMHTGSIRSGFEYLLFITRLHLILVNRFLAFTRYSEREVRECWRVPASRISVSSIGVDTFRYAPNPVVRAEARSRFGISVDDRVLLVVARLHPEKCVELAVRAACALNDDRYVLLVVGDGEERGRLEQLASDLPGNHRIHFLGIMKDTAPIYALSDILLQTTRCPNMGTVVLEAMASGMPVLIAYRDDDEYRMAKDTFDDVDAGEIAKATPEDIAITVKEMFYNETHLTAQRQAARAYAESRHSRRSVYPAMTDIYALLNDTSEH
ncbi:MAG: hypothetical protein C0509_06215 [Acinetobacter sp.]|uniref:glycosyltransferase n=1 Tax=Dechloromonas sp. ARDL1 TaxID=3322121 RepID=UPI003DA707D9|nr:hypothetical protein [Acinetobacter sp.]